MNKPLSPLEIGKNVLKGWEGKVISEEKPFVRLITDPVYVNGRWEALANVNGALCRIEVTPKGDM